MVVVVGRMLAWCGSQKGLADLGGFSIAGGEVVAGDVAVGAFGFDLSGSLDVG